MARLLQIFLKPSRISLADIIPRGVCMSCSSGVLCSCTSKSSVTFFLDARTMPSYHLNPLHVYRDYYRFNDPGARDCAKGLYIPQSTSQRAAYVISLTFCQRRFLTAR